MMKYLYIVDHAIPFPGSEYGGLWNVIAENNDECFNLISNHYEYKDYDEYFEKLCVNIINAQRFSLMDEQQSRIVEVFVT